MADSEWPIRTAALTARCAVDTALVRELAELLSANELTEIEVEDGDRKIKVAPRGRAGHGLRRSALSRAGRCGCAGRCARRRKPRRRRRPVDAVKSPMVGTAFLSPEPGAKPFIAVGDSRSRPATRC